MKRIDRFTTVMGESEKKLKNIKKYGFDPENYSATYPPTARSIYRREDERYILSGIRDLSNPFFLAKREAIMKECREVLGDDYDDTICPHCGRIEPCASYTISDAEPEEQLHEFSDDDSVLSFEEEYLRCLNRLAKSEI